MVAYNDDAMNALWERYDGPRRVQEVAASMGMPETAPPVDPGRWGQATTTAVDFAGVLSALEDMLDLRDAEMLLGWMRSTTAVASDGFYQRFGLLATGSGPVAAKQGWMCCIDDRRRLHSAGVIEGSRVVVLLGDFPAATSWARTASAFDTATAAVLTALGWPTEGR